MHDPKTCGDCYRGGPAWCESAIRQAVENKTAPHLLNPVQRESLTGGRYTVCGDCPEDNPHPPAAHPAHLADDGTPIYRRYPW